MADITVTAANVLASAGAVTKSGTAGSTVTAGQVLYADATDSNDLKLADADALATAAAVGIALNGASDGQPVDYIVSGTLTAGGTVVVGEIYCASPTAGGVAPEADVLSGDYMTVLGIGLTATTIAIDIQVSGKALP